MTFCEGEGTRPACMMALDIRRRWQIKGLLSEPERSTQPTIPIGSSKNSETTPTAYNSYDTNLYRDHSKKCLVKDTAEYLEEAGEGNIQQEGQDSGDGPEIYDEDIEILGEAGPEPCKICHQPGALITRLCRNCEIAWLRARGGSQVSKSLLVALAS
ncbi:hypothetical protein CDD81_6019 [Ophiocordyceps australis]|uniref:Uncharacterized protein n=1 Tax=Ophiocordyceps australis TaxID=1399860 RepID=A0A2C5XI28_9HYPO|nr:hypothetical protein CDD81_6019 [Ophiocordyceps australis]